MPEKLLLDIRDIHKSFGMNAVLKGISLKLGEGEVLALIGGNGAGKGVLGQKAVQDAAAKQGNAEKQCQQKQQDRAEHCAGTGRLFRRFRLFFRSSVCCRFGFLFCHMDSS